MSYGRKGLAENVRIPSYEGKVGSEKPSYDIERSHTFLSVGLNYISAYLFENNPMSKYSFIEAAECSYYFRNCCIRSFYEVTRSSKVKEKKNEKF